LKFYRLIILIIVLTGVACKSDSGRSLTHIDFSPTILEIDLPSSFPRMELPLDNDLTHEKVELGQHLFYDPILSIDGTMSCASCHFPESSFTDGKALSKGVQGIEGTKSAMSLINVAFYNTGLFWDGRIETLEEQALLPIVDPIELHNNWPGLMIKLKDHETYPEMFRSAFGVSSTSEMTKEMVAKALASFQRIIISGNSFYDQTESPNAVVALNDDELDGKELFYGSNTDELIDAHCGDCHSGPLFTNNSFANNGLTQVETMLDFPDFGYGNVTGNSLDNGKFRVPTLRNISLTAPYMHDGRFETLEEVIDHYDSGGVFSPNKHSLVNPRGLTEGEKRKIHLFLLTLVDTSYLENEYVKNPFN